MADDSDIPPLEDMSDLIKQAQVIREKQERNQKTKQTAQINVHNGHVPANKSSKVQPPVKPETNSNSQKPTEPVAKQEQSKSTSSSGFGGFKKGFLFGGSSSKPKQANSPKQVSTSSKPAVPENIPFITKTEDAEKQNLKIPEVQKNISTMEQMTKNADWVTDELLNKVEANKSLVTKLGQRKYIEALNMFQSNPVAAMQKYKDDSDMKDFLTQTCAIMGEHFTNLADKQENETPTKVTKPSQNAKIQEIDDDTADALKQKHKTKSNVDSRGQSSSDNIHTRSPTAGADMSVRSSTNPKQATATDEKKMKEILDDPEIRNILMDSQIQELFSTLRSDPDKGQRFLANAGGDLKMKIGKLVQCGLLQFQS